jgi:hypothetical protein
MFNKFIGRVGLVYLDHGTDQKVQDKIHNFSRDTFYPILGAKVTTSQYFKFI